MHQVHDRNSYGISFTYVCFRVDDTVSFSACVSKLVSQLILKNACKVRGLFFHEAKKANHAMEYMDAVYDVYKAMGKPHKVRGQVVRQ